MTEIARKARVNKLELDEGFQPYHPPFRNIATLGTPAGGDGKNKGFPFTRDFPLQGISPCKGFPFTVGFPRRAKRGYPPKPRPGQACAEPQLNECGARRVSTSQVVVVFVAGDLSPNILESIGNVHESQRQY